MLVKSGYFCKNIQRNWEKNILISKFYYGNKRTSEVLHWRMGDNPVLSVKIVLFFIHFIVLLSIIQYIQLKINAINLIFIVYGPNAMNVLF